MLSYGEEGSVFGASSLEDLCGPEEQFIVSGLGMKNRAVSLGDEVGISGRGLSP